MGSETDNAWNLMARIAIEQILERNDNGNLSPLTEMEIRVLNDFYELVSVDEGQPAEDKSDAEPENDSASKDDDGSEKTEFKNLSKDDLNR
ncbi:MAG: hypothetical protein PHN44_02320 [Candidatus Marinimicrobia bacterium]|nr:hypothetical protein [Candidatus Neomarinimicrobiota bacterium]MDD5539829.1 hypothetical protein [Candidatus Neomarinimicrobiota bacterium]